MKKKQNQKRRLKTKAVTTFLALKICVALVLLLISFLCWELSAVVFCNKIGATGCTPAETPFNALKFFALIFFATSLGYLMEEIGRFFQIKWTVVRDISIVLGLFFLFFISWGIGGIVGCHHIGASTCAREEIEMNIFTFSGMVVLALLVAFCWWKVEGFFERKRRNHASP